MPSVNIDRRALGEVFKDPRTLRAFESLFDQAYNANPGSVAAAFNAPSFSGEFGGVGDGTTNNDQAFNDAEASAYERIWLPEGVFLTTLNQSSLTKFYFGPGKIEKAATYVTPGRFSYVATAPQIASGTGAAHFWDGDTSRVEPEWHVLGPGTRNFIANSRYYEAGYIPHPLWFDVYAGGSGWLTTAAGAANPGDTTMTLLDATPLSAGKTYGVTNQGQDGTVTDTITIDAIVGNVITFHPPLGASYPNIDPPPENPAPGRAVLMDTHRTWNGAYYAKVTNYLAGGDVYGGIARMVQNYVPNAGQTHYFQTSTVGQYGGDVTFGPGSSGTYATGWESQYTDNGEDVAVQAQVDSLNRTNDTGARAVVWMGINLKSEGTKPADVTYLAQGKWRAVLDTVKCDLTTFVTAGDNINAAINTALGHRWVMNSTASNAGRGGSAMWGTPWGNTPGDMFIESGNDGTSDFIALRFNGAAGVRDGRLRVRPTLVTTNVSFQGSKTIEAGLALVCGTAQPQVVFGPGSGVWIEWSGTNLRATKDNGATWAIIV